MAAGKTIRFKNRYQQYWNQDWFWVIIAETGYQMIFISIGIDE
jgi:hypothetical protein